MHLLTLTPFYPTAIDDATGCFVAEPLKTLAANGIQNSILAMEPFYRGHSGENASAPAAERIRYWAFPGGFGLSTAGAFVFARIISRIRQLHAQNRIDVIHAHAPLPAGHAAMLVGKELGIPYVVSVHGLDAFSTMQVKGRAGKWCRRITQRVYEASRRVICISEHVREEVLAGMGRTCRTSVVYNGVDPELFHPAAEEPSDSQTVLSVGNLIPVKGHELLVRAAAALAPEFPSLSWEIIGDGPERPRLEALTKQLKIADRIRFLGRQSRKQVAAAMQRCTLFVLPSRYEGLGCVYLEAMATGKPAIGCRGQGIAEIIQHGSNGLLVGPNNEQELKLATAMVLRDANWRLNLGRAARNTILENLTLARQAEQLTRIYRECSD